MDYANIIENYTISEVLKTLIFKCDCNNEICSVTCEEKRCVINKYKGIYNSFKVIKIV